MLTHIVMFKLLDRSEENIRKTREFLMSMEGKIPYLRHIEVGIDVLRSERSYDIALVTKFDSLDDMQAYQIHPVHQGISKHMQSIRESSVTVDYEG